MIFKDIPLSDVSSLLSNIDHLPEASLIYLINFAGLTDMYMEENKLTYSYENIGLLTLYHKLFHNLPRIKLNLSEPNDSTAKALLLVKIIGDGIFFCENDLEECCKEYSEKYRRTIEDTIYPLVVNCKQDPFEGIDFNMITRGIQCGNNLCGDEIDIILSELPKERCKTADPFDIKPVTNTEDVEENINSKLLFN